MIDEWKKGAKYWDHAWNPVIGCRKVSEGCANCYAARTMERFGQSFEPHLSKRQTPPKSGVVFVGNMTDLFGEWNEDAEIVEWFNMLSPAAINLILTKRVISMGFATDCLENYRPWQHLWLGMTAENQVRYDERIGLFRCLRNDCHHWLSAEPLLYPIDMQLQYIAPEDMPFDWVVVGAESGPNRRPCKLEWIENIVDQCRWAGVPVFVKQLEIAGKLVKDINKFPPELQIRQVPWKRVEK